MLKYDIEEVFKKTESAGVCWNKKMISRAAITALLENIPIPNQQQLIVVELGGEETTLFWNALNKQQILSLDIYRFEHDYTLFNHLHLRIEDEQAKIIKQTLRQISNEQWEELFADPLSAADLWGDIGTIVSNKRSSDYTIQNAFYAEAHMLEFPENSIDILIIDGPHGNGRSLCFPIFYRSIKEDCLVLMDDFDHYPFLHDLNRLFEFEILRQSKDEVTNWILLRIKARREVLSD